MDTVFLFDLDGVLIRPGGYRAAMRASFQSIFQRMGLRQEPPGADVFDMFEAQGITNEWDMIALVTALALDCALQHARVDFAPWQRPSPVSYMDQALHQAGNWNLDGVELDYRPLSGLAEFVGQQVTPSAAVLAALQRGQPLFLKRLPEYPELLEELFASVEDVARAPLTRLHQHHVVGSREFVRAYRLPAEFETPSYLELHDQPLLQPQRRDALLRKWRSGEIGMAAFTARPSLPPRELEDGRTGYTAEAEMALRLNGLQEIPLIGYGRLRTLAEHFGQSAEQLIKPEPWHALAALLAALWRAEWPALQAAGSLLHGGELPGSLASRGELQVHVFEDAPIGVRAAARAVEILRARGIQARLHAWGIAQNPDKARALEAEGAQVFPDVNAVLDHLKV